MSKNYIDLTKVRAQYDHKTGIIRLTTKDPIMNGKPFQITLRKETDSTASLFEAFQELNGEIINDCNSLPPSHAYLPKSFHHLKIITENSDQNKAIENSLMLHIGQTQTNESFAINLRTAGNTLIAGATGSGKTELMRSIAAQITKNDNSKLVWISGRDTDKSFIKLREKDVFASDLHNGASTILQLFHTLQERYAQIDSREESSSTSLDEMPPIFLMIDEISTILSPAGIKTPFAYVDDSIRMALQKALYHLLKLGSHVNIYIFASTQRPDATLLSKEHKELFTRRIGMGQIDNNADYMIFGEQVKYSDRLRTYGRGIIRTNNEFYPIFQAYQTLKE